MKDQILKIAKVKNEAEFYRKYPSEEAFMKAHGKAFKKAAMGSKMVNDQLHQLTDFGNPPIAQYGAAVNPNTGMFQMPMSGKSVSQFDTMAAGYGSTPPPEGFGNVKASGGGGGFDATGAGMAGLQGIGKVIGGIEAIAAQKKAQKKAQQSAQLGELALTAQQTMEKPKNQYVRPEDSLVQPGQLGNPYGTGTNYLGAKNGTMIGGNPTEIQNTYAPTGDLYRDLGYEPLEESVYKQYRRGGNVPKAEFGEYFQDSGQAQIGSAVGGAVAQGFGLPPAVGELVGKVAGNLLGGAKDARKLQAQKDKAALNQSMMGFEQARAQGPLSANLEHGGWISHDWQPQTFTKFGEYSAKDLLKPPHDADMLRAGGSIGDDYYTPPSARALQTYEYGGQMALGGELQIGDGGYAETLSYNPNLPGGEIGMFRGASHDNGGIQTQYGENGVEVEGGEPFTILEDNGSEDGNNLEGGGSKENLVVFGNIKINKEIADLMGDPKAKGKKFKTYIADVAKNDAKQLKTIQKGLDLIEEYDGNSSYDKLGMNSGMASLMGAKAQQKINADKIKEAGLVQDSIHQTARQLGVKSDKLAEGKLEKEKDPSMVAQYGTKKGKYEEYEEAMSDLGDYDVEDVQKVAPSFNPIGEPSVPEFFNLTDQRGPNYAFATTPKDFANEFDKSTGPTEKKGTRVGNALKYLGKGVEKFGPTVLSNLDNFLRPSNANEGLPPDQLYPEYFAMATNQLEPVQAQQFQPMLDTPYDISFNDQINAIDSQSRAFLRAAGNNPAAQAAVMAQTIEAKNKLFGEVNRVNQANKIAVYDKNRALLNDAKLKNLAINDKQYERQSEAKSKTKEQNQAIVSSIAAKTAQQRATNRKLAIMENLYGFRFSPSGRAINANAPAQFNMSGNPFNRSTMGAGQLAEGYEDLLNTSGQRVATRRLPKGDTSSLNDLDSFMDKNGGKTPKKNARNGSIVNALKNL